MRLRENYKYLPQLQILEELKAIRKDLDCIKNKMEAEYLTPEEETVFDQGMKDYREGKCISLEELKKCLKLK